MPIAKPRERGRGKVPRILMNGQAAAYSSFRRIRRSVTVSPGKIACQTSTHLSPRPTLNLGQDEVLRSEVECPRPASYFAACCAHFASVVRKAFAAGGGSTSPVNAALKVIM